MNNITEKLWDYIDGNCTAEEHAQISRLIEHDEEYQRIYTGLLQLHNEFNAIELDEPPMAFTHHVMEQIRTQQASVPLKAAVNKYLIWGIAALFIGSIVLLFVFMLSGINWSAGQNTLQLPEIWKLSNPGKYFTGAWLNGFLLFDVVLGLFLLDTYLHKRMNGANN